MPTITLSFAEWRDVVDTLRASGIDSMREHADQMEHALDRHPPDAAAVSLSLRDDVYLRSYNWARWQLGIPLPRPER